MSRQQNPSAPRSVRKIVRTLLTTLAAGVSVVVAAGCATIQNPGLRQDSLAVPEAKRAHVYAIFLNSMNDPLGFTNFKALYKFAVDCGFTSARYHHFDGGTQLAAEVREILKSDREAKICLIGWSGASLYAFDAANMVASSGIVIDEIVYLDSNWIKEQRFNTTAHPTNVARVALLYSENRTAPTNVPNPVFYKIPVETHTEAGSAPQSGEVIVKELILLANRAPANK